MRSSRVTVLVLAGLLGATRHATVAQDDEGKQTEPVPRSAEFVRVVTAVSDTVLHRHVDPPTRQEMVLHGVRAMLAAAGHEVPVGLGHRLSSLDGDQQWREFLTEMWKLARSEDDAGEQELRGHMISGMLAIVPGAQAMIPPEEYVVAEQLRANRYVGIGIQLSQREGIPLIVEPFRGGPAREAGALPGDLILSVDGVETQGKSLADLVDLLRGAEGTDVTVVVRQSMADEERTLEMTRGVVPIDTIFGARRTRDGGWEYRPTEAEPIAYLNIPEMKASTLHELRRLEQRLRDEGCRALVLDLRNSSGGDLQQAIFLADAFLSQGRIGSVGDAKGTREYEADADCLFRDWPMAVLVGQHTSGEAEWLAAALQDNGRAELVGEPTWGQGYASELVELPNSLGALQGVRFALLRRADGRSLARPASALPTNRGGDHALLPGRSSSAQRQSPWVVQPDHIVRQPPTRLNVGRIGRLREFARPARPIDAPLKISRELLTAALAEREKREPAASADTEEDPDDGM